MLRCKQDKRDADLERRNYVGLVNIDKNSGLLGPIVKEAEGKMPVRVRNSLQEMELHHFKVLELRTYEDLQQSSQCRVLFSFNFKMLRQQIRNDLENMDWDIDSKPVQHLYLSQNTEYMMEVVNNFFATVYSREYCDNKDETAIDFD